MDDIKPTEENSKPVEAKSAKPAKVETPEINVSQFMRDYKNFTKLKQVVDQYGFQLRLDGQRMVHNIPVDQLAGMIAQVK